MKSLRDTYHKLISILFALAFSINLCLISTLAMVNAPFNYSKWLPLGNADSTEILDLLVTSRPIIVTEPFSTTFSFFKDTFSPSNKPLHCIYKPQIRVARYFFPTPQICSHTGIFMCLRL
ncbi:MAG: hypothetical protein PHD06_04760 [Bacteroidales bacterium]|nr:hypothetical protein [Bacteroidales bacterium]MDD4384470.1 hypothetical protein [Bacteroidales bacterium]MDY0196823.1 hypothetical protein [Tenuifilaceae bacterium]